MVSGKPRAARKSRPILLAFLICVGLLFFAGAIFIAALIIPTTVPQSHEVSPDGRTRVTIILEAYSTFGPVIYVVRIGPENPLLRWALQKKLIETDAEDSRVAAPTATWTGAQSVVINLPVKQDKLATAIREGLYPRPAADHYGAIQIIYRAQQ
jgi:hypothetical protein